MKHKLTDIVNSFHDLHTKDYIKDRIPPAVFVNIYTPLHFITNAIYNPAPGHSFDFLTVGGLSGVIMTITGSKNKTLEFCGAMTPAAIGSLDEYLHFIFPYNVTDIKDCFAYFEGALLTYFGARYLRRKLFQRKKELKSSLHEDDYPKQALTNP
ncbi:hypothetical protein AYK26_04210 [Euryarchaeota archaeon SM23-78]|nr:MAG: hypothetical protein AYK26_04210 [Euryarchaeota archaeon SM23-78]MBW3001477.1 hypothetical protein [Candidatus Woesearchaeota archaeon]